MNKLDLTKPVQTRSGVLAGMTTTEHLQRIRAKCVELLAIAEKRTPGKWEARFNHESVFGPVFQVMQKEGNIVWSINACSPAPGTDPAFIAACAGAAEAGWRSTIAAIDGLERYENFEAMFGHTCPELDTILAAWPEELL